MSKRLTSFVVVLVAIVAWQAPPHGARGRSIVDLGGIANRRNYAMGINDSGDVVGIGAFQSENPSEMRGLLWSRGQVTELPPLPGDFASIAYDVNNRGQVVGASFHTEYTIEPVMWDHGQPISLNMWPGADSGLALDINDRGEIVGLVTSAADDYRAFIWRNGVMSDLLQLAPGSFSNAWGINNRGQVVGQAIAKPGGPSIVGGFVWDNGVITALRGLGGQAGNTVAYAINDRGDIVGQSQTVSEDVHAILWRKGTIIDLGTLHGAANSVALSVNNRGEVVGQSDPGRGFLWQNGVMVDLGILDSDFGRAESINNRGDIAGLGYDIFGMHHAVVWTTNPQHFVGRVGDEPSVWPHLQTPR